MASRPKKSGPSRGLRKTGAKRSANKSRPKPGGKDSELSKSAGAKALVVRRATVKKPPASDDQPLDGGTHSPPFLVAAVGASAGGLEAFSALLGSIPGDTAIALVLVQHLAREQRSILPELLSSTTTLNVAAGQDGQKIEPRHVYVIPPDTQMTVADGELRVRPTTTRHEYEGTVDAVFRSIAAEYRERAVGVVLSGSASDGAVGIRAIKAAGGLTIAQQPEQATVDGMPRAAIATGAIDAVLSVEEIGEHLVRLARHPFFSRGDRAEPALPGENPYLQNIFHLLRRASGVDFSNYKMATLKRRIDRRMALHRISNLAAYVAMLDRDPGELGRLQEELLIHVTSFFREPASYKVLEKTVFPALNANKDRETPIRIWVPGCSTGEEVYSLAMITMEFLGANVARSSLQIFGTDISDTIIDKARAGIYPHDIAADVSAERLRRFFTRFDGGYRINKEVRDRCVFARQDVIRDPPFSKLDLVVCRNLLIYLNQETQRRVLGVFHYALRPNGFLMLGRSETVGPQAHLFAVLDKRAQLYTRKKLSAPRPEFDLTPTPPSPTLGQHAVRPPVHHPTLPPEPWDPQTDANRFLLDRYAPPAVIIDNDHRVLRTRGGTGAFLELPSGEVSMDVLKMVRPELLHDLRTALLQARTQGRAVSKQKARFRFDGQTRTVTMHVVPVGRVDNRQFLVLFDDQAPPANKTPASSPKSRKARPGSPRGLVEQELAETRHQMHSIIDDLAASNEELQSANEEILSSNEELQSTNEELDTAKEEMQSTNEELSTLNDELHTRNEELSALNGDLVNLLATVQIPIVMVTRDLRIRRFTPAAEKAMNIIPSDVGRPIGHLKPNFICPDLEAMIAEVIDTVSIRERQVEGTEDGRVFTLQIRPYKSMENRIDGAVVVMFDVSTAQDQAAALEVSQAVSEAALATAREPILLLDGQLKVIRANRTFLEQFQVTASAIAGTVVYDLSEGAWDSPALRRLLEKMLPEKKAIDDFEIVHDFGGLGRKRLLVDVRRIDSGRRKQGAILLVFREVAELPA